MSNRNKNLIINMIFFGLVTLVSKGISYILLPLFTNYMSTADYGVADLLVSTVNMLYPLTALGMGAAILRFTITENDDRKIVFSSALRIICFTSLILLIFIPFIIKYGGVPAAYAWFIPLEMFFVNIVSITVSLCKGINKTNLFLLQSVIKACVLFFSAYITLKFLNMGIMGYIISYLLADAVSIICFVFSVHIDEYVTFHIEKDKWKIYRNKLIKYGAPLVPNSMSSWVVQMSDRYMVAYWYGPAVTGIYAVAYKIPSLVKVATSTFISAWQLNVISEAEKNDSNEYFNKVKNLYSAICFIMAGFIMIFIKALAKVLFSGDFYEAWRFVPLLVLASILDLLSEYLGTYFFAKDRTSQLFLSTFLGAIINIILNFSLIPSFGAWGATLATIMSTFVMYLHRGFDIRHSTGLNAFSIKEIVCICLFGFLCVMYHISEIYGLVVACAVTIFVFVVFGKEVKIMYEFVLRVIHKEKDRGQSK